MPGAFSLVLVVSLLGAEPLEAEPLEATLRGSVVDAHGQPVVAARVDISTAAPRVGRGVFCPSCYLDCKKSARTDGLGNFNIPSLDPALKFRVLISAPGKRPHLTKLVDPAFERVAVTLEDLPADLPPEHVVRGIVVDGDGVPIEGALVEPGGAKTATRRFWGANDAQPAVTDSKGQFVLPLPEDYQGVDVSVQADGTAGAAFALLPPGGKLHRLAVPAGTEVTGTLLLDGQPLAGVRLAVVQVDRAASRHFVKAVGDTTDAAGRFAFRYLPADEDYVIFSVVGELPQEYVITTKKFKARGNGETRDLGSLAATVARRLAGRVEAPGGQPVPAEARIVLGRDPAWDLIAVPIAPDGRFSIEGLPPEAYTIAVAGVAVKLDASRLPYQMLEENSFGLRLRQSIENLVIPLQP